MRQRVTVLVTVATLLMVGAAPVSAAPGGVPGPPPGHGRAADDAGVDDAGVEARQLPVWAKAYGKRIKDMFGVPFGHLQQCAKATDGGEGPESSDAADGDDGAKAREACPTGLVFPEGEHGAAAFWVFTESGLPIVGL